MASIAESFEVANPRKAFEKFYASHSIPTYERNDVKLSEPIGRVMDAVQHGMTRDDETGEALRRQYSKFWFKNQFSLEDGDAVVESEGITNDVVETMAERGDQNQKAMDANVVESSTPLVFDPEILSLIIQNAPLRDRVMMEGQEGYSAVYNNISSRDASIGWVSESDSLNLFDNTESDIGMSKNERDMKIWVDKVTISDFSNRAFSHYNNLRDTTLGERLAVHAQDWEQTLLYGDPSEALSDGSPGDSNAPEGIESIITSAGNNVDKSGVSLSASDALLKDVKAEIIKMLQSTDNVNPMDLEIWTSWTAYDEMDNELTGHGRIDLSDESVNFGDTDISIGPQVPVIPTHNVRSHSFGGGSYTPGDEGDVFIVDTGRSIRWRQLAPLSTVPLGRRGLSDEVAMFEYGAPVARAEGNFGRYLSAYNV